ncbi:TPA: hypothetical protein R1707_001537, partial [Campylobacter lari]|nr:hypothetical protein [Campylobacter lari]
MKKALRQALLECCKFNHDKNFKSLIHSLKLWIKIRFLKPHTHLPHLYKRHHN